MGYPVLIPYRGNDEWRRESVATVIAWVKEHGHRPVVVGSPDEYTAGAEDVRVDNMPAFHKARAWNYGMRHLLTGGTAPDTPVLLLDSDILVGSQWLNEARVAKQFTDQRIVAFHPFDQIEDLEKLRTFSLNHGEETFAQLRLTFPDHLR